MPWMKVSTMEERTRFVVLAESGKHRVADLCRQFGISRTCGYKWLERKKQLGLGGLREMSRRPRRNSRSIDKKVEKLVLKLRRRWGWGASKLLDLLVKDYGLEAPPCVNTIGNVLKRHGMTRPRRRRRAGAYERCRQELTAAEHANHVWAVDFKGWFLLGNGMRCDPLTISDLYSRYVICCKALPGQTQALTRRAFKAVFKTYGLPEIIRVDNGTPFASIGARGLSTLSVWWISLGIDVEYIRRGKPQDNGSHERMHKTLKEEATQPVSRNMRSQQRRFERWKKVFNEKRPHEHLDMKRPGQLYHPSGHRYDDTDRSVEYPEGFVTKKVQPGGYVRFEGDTYFIGEAFVGFPVGIRLNDSGEREVYFANVRLGKLINDVKDPFRPPAYMGP